MYVTNLQGERKRKEWTKNGKSIENSIEKNSWKQAKLSLAPIRSASYRIS